MVKAKAKSSDYTPAPAGTHIARCVQVIDLGTQYSEHYGNSNHKVLLGWELPGMTRVVEGEEQTVLVWKRYTLSLSQKATLRADLESWRGVPFSQTELQGFDLSKVLGVPCMVSITHTERDGDIYANVASVVGLPRGTAAPPQESEIIDFDIDDWNSTAFETFSEKLQETIKASPEYKALQGHGNPPSDSGEAVAAGHDDIPF